jgi:hypothetical protein
MFKMEQIIGKKVKELRGFKKRKNQKDIGITFILFDDGETFIDLELQDGFTFHDCDHDARIINIKKDAKLWREIAYNNDRFGNANVDI